MPLAVFAVVAHALTNRLLALSQFLFLGEQRAIAILKRFASMRKQSDPGISVLKMSTAHLRSCAKLTNVISAPTLPNQPIYRIGPVAQRLPLIN